MWQGPDRSGRRFDKCDIPARSLQLDSLQPAESPARTAFLSVRVSV